MSYNYNWPAVSISSGPIQFNYNAVATTVSEDTATPGNSKPLPVITLSSTGNVTDTNFGTVGANTPRTAAEIGNATGAADFNFGTVGAQTLRSAAQVGNATGAADFNFGTVGAQTLRSAAQIGNTTGAADYNAGATGAQTLRTVANQGAPNTIANAWKVAGTDGTNSQAYLATGEAKVSVTQALPTGANVIGAVTQSGTWNTNDAANGPVTPGTVATKSELVGLQFNTVLPTVTTAQQVAAQCDSSGRVLVGSIASALPTGANTIGAVNQGTANATPWNQNISQVAGAVPSATNALPARLTNGTSFLDYGNGAISANTLRVSAQLANATGAVDYNAGNASAQTQRVVIATDQVAVSTKAATPASATITAAAISVGTTAVRLTVAGTAPSATRAVLIATIDSAASGKFYVGPSTVTSTGTTRGIQLLPGEKFIANNDACDYYIISDTTAQTVEVLEHA